MTINSEALVAWANHAFKHPLTKQAQLMTRLALVDQYGLQIAGSAFPWSQAILNHAIRFGKNQGPSSVTRFSHKLTPSNAAFVNGSFAHAQDFDDSHQLAQTHPGSVVIPAAMAVGEYLNTTTLLTEKAISVGMETMLRLAYSLCPACIQGGHHTPPTVGPFGAAIAAGLLLKLTPKQMQHALGICGSYAGGLVEYTITGGSVKRIHTGLGARAGVEAALLAQEGITGPSSILEGKKGMWEIFGRGKAFPEKLIPSEDEHWLLETLMFKPYNCCYLIHPAIEVFINQCHKHQLTPEDIVRVDVGLSEFSLSHAGTIREPKDALGAQFSTHFTLALSLVHGAPNMWSYNDENLHDKIVRELADKVFTFVDPEINKNFPAENGCLIKIATQHNKYIAKISAPKGSPTNLLSQEDVKKKFVTNTKAVIDDMSVSNIYAFIINFERSPRLKDFISQVNYFCTKGDMS